MRTSIVGGAVVLLVVLAGGGVAGATTVPVPGVGSVEVDSTGSVSDLGLTLTSVGTAGLVVQAGNGVDACAGAVSPYVPSGSVNACALDSTNPLGEPVEGVIVNNAGNQVVVFLNPLEAAVCEANKGCVGVSQGGIGGLGNLG
jgi:hypothetical protein